jgi:hypothetical protein
MRRGKLNGEFNGVCGLSVPDKRGLRKLEETAKPAVREEATITCRVTPPWAESNL